MPGVQHILDGPSPPRILRAVDTGQGAIDGEAIQVVYGAEAGQYAVFTIGRGSLSWFRGSGVFPRRVDRPGPGHAELGAVVDVQLALSPISWT